MLIFHRNDDIRKKAGKKAPDGTDPIWMDAVRWGLCPEIDAKGFLTEEDI